MGWEEQEPRVLSSCRLCCVVAGEMERESKSRSTKAVSNVESGENRVERVGVMSEEIRKGCLKGCI